MNNQKIEKQAFWFFIFAIFVFALMQALMIATKGSAAQEQYEVFRRLSTYIEDLRFSGNPLRVMLFLDLFFMIGYGGALALTASANLQRNPLMGWISGISLGLLILLDTSENLVMLQSLDLAQAGHGFGVDQISFQVAVSSAKWMMAAFAVVALTFVLPQNTVLERISVWVARIALPVGVGLFVTGAFDARILGGLFLMAGMGGGFVLITITIWLRRA